MLSLGLDVSSTSTGCLLLSEQGVVHQAVWKPPVDFDYLMRGSWQAEKLIALLGSHEPDQVCIEGYSLGSTNGAEPLITVATIIRYFLRQLGYDWQVIAPTQLKKYAQAKLKQDLKLAVFKRWEFEHSSDDVVDAYVLARIGLGMHGKDPNPLIGPQLEVLETLRNGKKKPKKKGA